MQRRLGDALARLRRRHALSARHRGPAGVDVARAHPQGRLEGRRRSGGAGPTRRHQRRRPPSWSRRRSSGSPTATAARRTSGGSSRSSRGCTGSAPTATRIAELMTSYFELTELHIHPRAQGRGLGEALARRLLAGRGESHVLLSTPEINGEVEPGLAAVPQARLHRHHPRLPLRGRPPPVRDPRPVTATLSAAGLAR